MPDLPQVVIVEDDALQAALVTMQIADQARVVARFGDVQAAQQWAGWTDVDGALVDWNLPDGSGAQVLDWLARMHPHVRCVILTAAEPPPRHAHAAASISKSSLGAAVAVLTGRRPRVAER